MKVVRPATISVRTVVPFSFSLKNFSLKNRYPPVGCEAAKAISYLTAWAVPLPEKQNRPVLFLRQAALFFRQSLGLVRPGHTETKKTRGFYHIPGENASPSFSFGGFLSKFCRDFQRLVTFRGEFVEIARGEGAVCLGLAVGEWGDFYLPPFTASDSRHNLRPGTTVRHGVPGRVRLRPLGRRRGGSACRPGS